MGVMVPLSVEDSNALFEVLSAWEHQLDRVDLSGIDFDDEENPL